MWRLLGTSLQKLPLNVRWKRVISQAVAKEKATERKAQDCINEGWMGAYVAAR